MKNPFHVMLIPTLGCPARCRYCWSSEPGSPVMDIEVVGEVIEWLREFPDKRVTFTFHGGEPLLAGAEFYRQALPLLSAGLPGMKPEFAIQTNLWLMTPEIADIFAKYHVPIGTSIDGPPEINDMQRGEGYFEKTMKGYEIAKAHGLRVSFICTFTAQSAQSREEIYHFFNSRGYTLKLHPALPSLRNSNPEPYTLDPGEYGELLVYLLDQSLEHPNGIEIMNISDLVKCVLVRHGTVCTFADCMGTTFAVGPDGSIYPCYRYVGMPEWVMGLVYDHPSREDLAGSDAWKRMDRFKTFVDEHCRECRHIRYCRGGCPYNAMVPTGGEIAGVDPHCVAYRRIFDEITERLDREMQEGPGLEMPASGPRMPKKPGIMSLMQRMVSR